MSVSYNVAKCLKRFNKLTDEEKEEFLTEIEKQKEVNEKESQRLTWVTGKMEREFYKRIDFLSPPDRTRFYPECVSCQSHPTGYRANYKDPHGNWIKIVNHDTWRKGDYDNFTDISGSVGGAEFDIRGD